MQFLELLPKYKCTYKNGDKDQKPFDCYPFPKNDDPTISFCDKPDLLLADVDYTNDLSLHNWIEDLKPDMKCNP